MFLQIACPNMYKHRMGGEGHCPEHCGGSAVLREEASSDKRFYPFGVPVDRRK
jgi:hypothetical protein